MFLSLLARSAWSCEPCESTLGLQETIQQADLIIVGQKIKNITEPGIPEEISPEILVRVDQTLKGFIKEKELKVHSYSGECPYGIVVDDKSYLIFLKGPPYTAVNQGCAVKTVPVEEGLVAHEGRRLSPTKFVAEFGVSVGESPRPDIHFLVDLSGNMELEMLMGAAKRIDCAKDALLNVVSQLPSEQEIGLRVFGRHPQTLFDDNCGWDSDLLLPFGRDQKEKVAELVKGFQAVGSAPLSYAIVQTELDFAPRKDRLHKLIIITYGEDTCSHDPIIAARDVANKGFALEVSVIGLDVKEGFEQPMKDLAKEFGGTFTNIKYCQELAKTLEEKIGRGGEMKIREPEGEEEGGGGAGAGLGGGLFMFGGGGSCTPEMSPKQKGCGLGILLLLILLLLWAIYRYWKRRRDRKNKRKEE